MANNASRENEKLEFLEIYNPILPHQTNIYFTVLNVIQAIAFGFLLLKSTALTDEFNWVFLFRTILVCIIIVIIWHRYAAESQFLWPLTWTDTIIPFSIGAVSFYCVFSVDPKISISSFLIWIMAIEGLAIAAYRNAFVQRQQEKTQRIYLLFYQDRLEIGKKIVLLLLSFDCQNMLWFVFLLLPSIIMLILSLVYYRNWYEIIFPIIIIILLVLGETRIRLYKILSKDPILKPYFD